MIVQAPPAELVEATLEGNAFWLVAVPAAVGDAPVLFSLAVLY